MQNDRVKIKNGKKAKDIFTFLVCVFDIWYFIFDL